MKKKYDKVITAIVAIIFICTLAYVIYYFVAINKANKEMDDIKNVMEKEVKIEDKIVDANSKEEIKVETPQPWDKAFMSVSFAKLKELNKDTVGWININGTKINYPVVQSTDNDFYLKNTFYKKKNIIGWIYADYRNNMNSLDDNTIIYGHSELLNNSMFTTLMDVSKAKWRGKNKSVINFNTVNSNMNWVIFSAYKIDPVTDYLATNFSNEEDKKNFIKLIKDRSEIAYKVDVDSSDKILTLSTCYKNKRFVVHAKLVK